MVLNWLRSRSSTGRTASSLYGSIVAQARQPAFFEFAGVPDTMEGRFGMIGVHMFLALERLRAEGDAGQELGRGLLECFMTDIDDSLREIGISDLGVPRRVKKAAAALHEQLDDYRAAASDRSALERHLAHHVFLDRAQSRPAPLVRYMDAARHALDGQAGADVLAGRITFPPFSA